jgi:dolichol kinase
MISALDLALIPVSIGALLGVMATVKVLGTRYGLSPELQRKSVHVASGLYALTLPFTFQSPLAVVLLLGVSVLVLLGLRTPAFAKAGIAAAVHSVERKSYGEIYLVLAVGIVFWLSAGNLVLYVLPILVLTLSDAAAALAGTRYGKSFFQVEDGRKSWEGVTVFFLVTCILSLVVLLLMTDISRVNLVVLAFLIAAFGALVEADSWGGLDNLFIPIGVHFLLSSHAASPAWELILLAAAFLLTLYTVVRLSPFLGVTAHSARAYVTLVFLICAMTAPFNAILAVSSVFAYIAAQRLRPSESRYPDLDFIAVSAGAGLFWLFAGMFFERDALNVYNLTFAGAGVALAGLAAGRATLPVRVAIVAVAAAAAVWVLIWAAPFNASSLAWTGAIWPWAAAGVAIAGLAATAAPAAFDRYRSARVMALALAVPLALFVTRGLMS